VAGKGNTRGVIGAIAGDQTTYQSGGTLVVPSAGTGDAHRPAGTLTATGTAPAPAPSAGSA
jgi:hypothetical protein